MSRNDDTISRQAAIVQLSHNKTGDDDCDVIIQNDIETIKALPSAQHEIIRCKDCKHWKHDHTCREHSLVSPMMANEFCSRAERREDD